MEENTRIKKDEIPFDKLEKVGVKKDFIDHMGENELRDFLNGYRSQKLYTINATVNDEQLRIPAKLRLQKQDNGAVDIKIHPIQRLYVPDEYMGHKFSKEEKAALLNDKNLGKTVELTGKDGKKDTYYLAIDNKTNELSPLRTKNIIIPDKIKGANLSEEQKQKLAKGEKVYLDKMTGRNRKKFGASLQVDAANRTINFSGFKQEKELEQEKTKKENKGAKQKVG
ncbi:DUF3945 domain-containing protein [Maribellus comscasis]|uniref:DUF3945 domain-containing protein n=1 Tax=Maribellus comscasis TaxID=2681766 RepID=A0A6I6JY65_9BACT|nr:DUF3945 domain-containing protein [Maribellus comscasis]QGY46080.1 DUF3945 domain-containing protein [Maribellus comscasis]